MMIFCYAIPGNPPISEGAWPFVRDGYVVACDVARGDVVPSAPYGPLRAEQHGTPGMVLNCAGVLYAWSYESGYDRENRVRVERSRLELPDDGIDFKRPEQDVGTAYTGRFVRITPHEWLPPPPARPMSLATVADLTSLSATSAVLLAVRTLLEASLGMARQEDLSVMLDLTEQLLQQSTQNDAANAAKEVPT